MITTYLFFLFLCLFLQISPLRAFQSSVITLQFMDIVFCDVYSFCLCVTGLDKSRIFGPYFKMLFYFRFCNVEENGLIVTCPLIVPRKVVDFKGFFCFFMRSVMMASKFLKCPTRIL